MHEFGKESEVAGELESEKRSAYIKMVLSGTFSAQEGRMKSEHWVSYCRGQGTKNKPGHT